MAQFGSASLPHIAMPPTIYHDTKGGAAVLIETTEGLQLRMNTLHHEHHFLGFINLPKSGKSKVA
jgi:hypothetical protein